MKITFFNATTYGGAAIAAIRLVEALEAFVDYKIMVVSSGNEQSYSFIKKPRYYEIRATFHQLLEQSYFYLFGNASDRILTLNKFGVVSIKDIKIDTDIIHLHWINRGFVSLSNLEEIGKLNKPIVWTLHDMSAFTGICSYSENCSNFHEVCGNCKYLKNNYPSDLSNKNFIKKRKIYQDLNLHIITCSEWLKDEAKKSGVLKNIPIYHIPNPIDTKLFLPMKQKSELRKQYKIGIETKVILFGAAKLKIPRKGFEYFKESLQYLLDSTTDILILLIGKGAIIIDLPFQTIQLNDITTEVEMAEIYNIADICVVPSLQDNFPNMVLEAMSCGIPVVGFSTGGIPEMIDHKENGYIAKIKDSKDLATGMKWTLRHQQRLSEAARNKVITHYSYEIIGKQYSKIYEKVLSSIE